MILKIFSGASIALALLSAPASLARYTPDTPATSMTPGATVVKASIGTRNETHHLLDLVSTIARPAPVLAVGAPVLTKEGLAVGQIADVFVHDDIIKAVVAMPEQIALAEAIVTEPQGPLLLLVPASAFETQSGNAVLAIPVHQLAAMEHLNP
jgi:hypothetical protein